MSCGEFRVLNEELDDEAQAQAQAQAQEQAPPQPNPVSPTQHYTQSSPPSSHSNPTYMLTAAAAAMHNQENPPHPSMEGNNDNNNNNNNNNSNEIETANATVNDDGVPSSDPTAAAASAATTSTTEGDSTINNNEPQEQPTFDVLTNMIWWRKGSRFAHSDALALIPVLDFANRYNPIFNDLLGDDLQQLVRHAIRLIQHILRIANHDWRLPDQIPTATDLSALSGMHHLMPHHQELLELHADRLYKPCNERQAGKPRSGGGGGGGGDKGGDDDGDGSDCLTGKMMRMGMILMAPIKQMMSMTM